MATASRPDDHAGHLRNALVEGLVEKGAIASQNVREAFGKVPRHLFVPKVDIATAYTDQPVFIRWHVGTPISSSTQPTMMAIMAEQLHLEPGCRVLEIGSGTGYNAAILAHIVGDSGGVITVDIDRILWMRLPETCPMPGMAMSKSCVGTDSKDSRQVSPTIA